MLDFYRSVGGRAFIEGTIPKLVRALERIATALEAQNPAEMSGAELEAHIAQLQVLLDSKRAK